MNIDMNKLESLGDALITLAGQYSENGSIAQKAYIFKQLFDIGANLNNTLREVRSQTDDDSMAIRKMISEQYVEAETDFLRSVEAHPGTQA